MFSPEHYKTLRERAALVDRSRRARLRLTGADRRTYLQGLLTNDIVALEPGSGCYATLLTPQGRMIADMRVLEAGDAILLDLVPAVRQIVFDKLEQFVFSEDVQVFDVTTSLAQIGVFGPRAAAVVSQAFRSAGGEDGPTLDRLQGMRVFDSAWWTFDATQALVVRSDEIGVEGFEIIIDAAIADPLCARLRSAGAEEVSEAAVEVCRIEAGRAVFGQDMDTDTIPLEAGIEDRAISLTKGCYVGQEIIIRVLHRGHGRVARRLVGLVLDAPAGVPAPGDVIRAGDRQVGSVTSAARSPALNRAIAMGYVHRDFTTPGTEVVIGSELSPATVSALPFVTQPDGSPAR